MFSIPCNYQKTIDINNPFIATIKENEEVVVNTLNAYGAKFQNQSDVEKLINDKNGSVHHHPLTGPIYVEGCQKGDVLKVHISKIEVEEMAISLSRTTGIDPISDSINREITIGRKDKDTFWLDDINLPIKPMIGIISTTSKDGIVKTGHAGKCGGNLDLPFIGEEVDIYLPVEVDGAGLYFGDVHACQGYGELSGIAMEASSKITFKVEIIKTKEKLENIIIHGKEVFSNEECIGVVGIGEISDITSSIKDAFLGSVSVVKRYIPNKSINKVKEIVTLIGNSFLGQAYSKTSESTSVVIFKKKDLERLKKGD